MFPRFKSRHRTAPAFRLRSKSKPGQTSPVRTTGPRGLRFPKLGELRAREHTGKLARMLGSGRFHVYAASFRFERGRWVVAVTGVAAQLHHQRRSPSINAALTLADRVYDCAACGLVIDRDVNAAVNLARYTTPPPTASPLPAAA